VHREGQDNQGSLVLRDLVDHKGLQETLEHLERKDKQDQQVRLVSLVI
jgi:hypothetical protein